VHHAERQPTARKGAIDRLDTERQNAVTRRLRVFDVSDLIAQRIEGGERGHAFKHRLTGESFLFVLFFPDCQCARGWRRSDEPRRADAIRLCRRAGMVPRSCPDGD
jgi:hypothetical protein